jgi:hypothetical protein
VPFTEIKIAPGVTTTVAVVLLELLLFLQPVPAQASTGKRASAVALAHRLILSLRIIETLTLAVWRWRQFENEPLLAAECVVRPQRIKTCGSP